MTIQVGMVGSDGIVLAGDTRRTSWETLSFNRPWSGSRVGQDRSKIQVSENKKIAVSSALDLDTAERIAAAIVTRLDISDATLIQERIQAIANNVFNAHPKPDTGFQCLVVVALNPRPKLFSVVNVKVEGESEQTAVCREWPRLAIAGDTVNGAIFWAERYYNQYQPTNRKPIAQLKPLCAHLVVCARSLNTAMIGGLEMVLCTSSGVEFQLEDIIQQLAEKAERREEKIAEMIFNDQ
jgi:hypothetical protein